MPAFGTALPCVEPATAPPGDAGVDFAGALDPPPLLSAGVFRLEAPAPVAPPVPDELMLEPLPDAPDPLCAPAGDVVITAAPSATIARIFMSAPSVEGRRWAARSDSSPELKLVRLIVHLQRLQPPKVPNQVRAG
ncbi:hypothetical protein [Bradyrhizobium sp. Gha]|uniref:hypothetical protein n=1 Tax=Bradyrhizobium sp. Gha TaxID=1855318 RepID=UPI0015A550C9|nr:hypothetical protein [Bradyrhizobium sp. Gha]